MAHLTPDERAAMREAEAKATKGPWRVSEATDMTDRVFVGDRSVAGCYGQDEVGPPFTQDTSNATFIALARTYVPKAEAEIRRLEARVRALEDWQHSSFNAKQPDGTMLCSLCDQPEARGHAPDCSASEWAKARVRELEAGQERD